MPPKKEEKKEVVPIFPTPKFWMYKPPANDVLEKTTAFLTTFEKELIQLISQQKTLQQNYQLLCEKIGVAVHPCLRHQIKEESKFPQLHNYDYGERLLDLKNFKIDAVTFRLVTFLISHYKITGVKISRNEIDKEADQLKKFLEREIYSNLLCIEWNPLQACPNRADVFLSSVRPSLQHLLLREDNLGNEITRELLKKIKSTPQIVLKSLDLAGNNLTPDITSDLCVFLEEEKNIQFLGLSKNELGGKAFLTKIFNSIGEIPLSEEEYAKHLESVKAKEEVIERNKKKKKGAADEPVPFVFEVKETENGKFYVKNTSLNTISLAKNGLTDSLAGLIKDFSEGHGAKVQIFLESNKFGKRSKDIFRAYSNLLL